MEKPVTQEQRADFLIRWLLDERKEYKDIEIPVNLTEKQRLLRSLMNVRPPVPADEEFLTVKEWQKENPDQMEVIFNVFKDNDYKIYKQLLR